MSIIGKSVTGKNLGKVIDGKIIDCVDETSNARVIVSRIEGKEGTRRNIIEFWRSAGDKYDLRFFELTDDQAKEIGKALIEVGNKK